MISRHLKELLYFHQGFIYYYCAIRKIQKHENPELEKELITITNQALKELHLENVDNIGDCKQYNPKIDYGKLVSNVSNPLQNLFIKSHFELASMQRLFIQDSSIDDLDSLYDMTETDLRNTDAIPVMGSLELPE